MIASVARWTVVATHGALVVVLLAMVVPSISTIRAQLGSDYIPSGDSMVIALVALPIVLAAVVVVAMVRWLRDRHRWLVAVDVLTTVAAFTVLWIFLFGNDWPVVSMGLAPTALAQAVLVPRASARMVRLDP
jgi:hypothetical protein